MSADKNRRRRQIKNERAKLKRRKDKLFEYANELHRINDVRVYVLLGKEKKYYSYNSEKREKGEKSFPPSNAWLNNSSRHIEDVKVSADHTSAGSYLVEKRVHKTFHYACELRSVCNADVYVLVEWEQERQYLRHNPTAKKSWPPSKKQLKEMCRLVEEKGPWDFRSNMVVSSVVTDCATVGEQVPEPPAIGEPQLPLEGPLGPLLEFNLLR